MRQTVGGLPPLVANLRDLRRAPENHVGDAFGQQRWNVRRNETMKLSGA